MDGAANVGLVGADVADAAEADDEDDGEGEDEDEDGVDGGLGVKKSSVDDAEAADEVADVLMADCVGERFIDLSTCIIWLLVVLILFLANLIILMICLITFKQLIIGLAGSFVLIIDSFWRLKSLDISEMLGFLLEFLAKKYML